MLKGNLELVTLCGGKLPENMATPLDAFLFSEADVEKPILDSKGNVRSFYLYTPASGVIPCSSGIYILREEATEESAVALLEKTGWAERAEREHYILVLPNPTDEGWNVDNDAARGDDYEFVHTMLNQGSTLYMLKGKAHRTSKYLAGFGTGATIAAGVCMTHGEMIVSLFAEEATMPVGVEKKEAPVATWLVNCADEVGEYFKAINVTAEVPWQVFDEADETLYATAWDELFLGLRRWPIVGTGIVAHKMTVEEMGLEAHVKEVLGDNDDFAHDWFEFVPSVHAMDASKKLPLLVGCHGGGTSAKYYAEQNRWHELGEKFGFFVVYPQACVNSFWNAACDERFPSDEEYLMKLVDAMVAKYPIDESRIYCTGFSMGGLMTQTMGMLHWDRFAAIAPFSSYLFAPYWEDVYPFHLVEKRAAKLAEDTTQTGEIALIQFYGTKDGTWNEDDGAKTRGFWSKLNGVTIDFPNGTPDAVFGLDERFDIYDGCDDEGTCRYRFVSVKDLAHAVDTREPYLAWDFLSRFSK